LPFGERVRLRRSGPHLGELRLVEVARQLHQPQVGDAQVEYLERAGMPRVPADLADHETVVYSQASNVWNFSRDGTEVSVLVRGRVRFNAAEGIRAAVLAGMGLTIASDWMFASELAGGRVLRLLDGGSLPDIDLWTVFPTGRLAMAKARLFAEFVAGVMQGSGGR
jgi:DNA-binding transcriptional LysR family regulator